VLLSCLLRLLPQKDIVRRFELEKFAAKGTAPLATSPPSPERKKNKQKA
jgi:hypothetical protein